MVLLPLFIGCFPVNPVEEMTISKNKLMNKKTPNELTVKEQLKEFAALIVSILLKEMEEARKAPIKKVEENRYRCCFNLSCFGKIVN
jgi:hypothetical protein